MRCPNCSAEFSLCFDFAMHVRRCEPEEGKRRLGDDTVKRLTARAAIWHAALDDDEPSLLLRGRFRHMARPAAVADSRHPHRHAA